jgi:hypothetical protein
MGKNPLKLLILPRAPGLSTTRVNRPFSHSESGGSVAIAAASKSPAIAMHNPVACIDLAQIRLTNGKPAALGSTAGQPTLKA